MEPLHASALYGMNDLGTTAVCSPVEASQPNTAGSIQPSGASPPTGCTRLVGLQERAHRLHQVGGVNQVFIVAAPGWWGRRSGGTSYTGLMRLRDGSKERPHRLHQVGEVEGVVVVAQGSCVQLPGAGHAPAAGGSRVREQAEAGGPQGGLGLQMRA